MSLMASTIAVASRLLPEAEQARQAVQVDVESAVRAVASRAGELATGRTPDAQVVNDAVTAVMSAGVSR